MRKLIVFCFVVLQFSTFGQTSQNIDLLAHWYEDSIICNSSLARFSDCYGFTWKNEEYAVIGSTEGTHIFQLTSDNQLIPKGFIKGRFSDPSVHHRDYMHYQNYLYAVSDEGVASLQIIDFQYLPDSVYVIKEDTVNFGRVHTLFIDTLNARLYSCTHRSTVNTQTIASPMKVFSLADPLNLVEIWSGPDDIPEVHDCYVTNNKAYLNCGYDGLRVYDFSVLPPLYTESISIYQDQGYNHQGWLTPDGKTYLFADETNGKRVKKCNVNGNLVQIDRLFGENWENGSIPHNMMCDNEFAYVAYYNEGFFIYDLRYEVPQKIAFYDTYPQENPFQMNGNWGVWSDLPSGRILASDRQNGLFVFGFNKELFKQQYPFIENPELFPSIIAEGQNVTISFPIESEEKNIQIYDLSGRLVYSELLTDYDYSLIETTFKSGLYYVHCNYIFNNKAESKVLSLTIY